VASAEMFPPWSSGDRFIPRTRLAHPASGPRTVSASSHPCRPIAQIWPRPHHSPGGRLAFDRTLPPPEALGRIRDAFADYDAAS
jgi:hypothetical protein